MPQKLRLVVGVVAIAFCILAISSAFIVFYGQVFQPPPLLNTNMKFWTVDPTKNILTPYLWTIDLIQGSTDNVTVYQTQVADRLAIALRVIRNDPNNSQVWTTVHVRQDLRGQALEEIFNSKIMLDVYPTFPYWYNPTSNNPENTYGVEINDGTNLLWYVFADQPNQVFQLPHHRIVLTQTPLNTWSTREIDIASQFEACGLGNAAIHLVHPDPWKHVASSWRLGWLLHWANGQCGSISNPKSIINTNPNRTIHRRNSHHIPKHHSNRKRKTQETRKNTKKGELETDRQSPRVKSAVKPAASTLEFVKENLFSILSIGFGVAALAMILGATLTPAGQIIGQSLVLIEVEVLPGFFMKPITFFQFSMFLSFAFGLYAPLTRRRMLSARPSVLRTVYIGAWLVAMGSAFEIIYQMVLWSAALAVQGLANPDVVANPFPVSVNPTPINVVFASKVIVAIFFMSAFLIDYIHRIDRTQHETRLIERLQRNK